MGHRVLTYRSHLWMCVPEKGTCLTHMTDMTSRQFKGLVELIAGSILIKLGYIDLGNLQLQVNE